MSDTVKFEFQEPGAGQQEFTTHPILAFISDREPDGSWRGKVRPQQVEIHHMRGDYTTWITKYEFNADLFCRVCGSKGIYVEDRPILIPEDGELRDACPVCSTRPGAGEDGSFDARFEWYQWMRVVGFDVPAPKIDLKDPDVEPPTLMTAREVFDSIRQADMMSGLLGFLSHIERITDRALDHIVAKSGASIEAVRFCLNYVGPNKFEVRHYNGHRFEGYEKVDAYLRKRNDTVVYEEGEDIGWCGVLYHGGKLIEIRRAI